MQRVIGMTLSVFIILTSVLLGSSLSSAASESGELVDLLNMPLEELTHVSVVTASKREQLLSDAPGVITVMSAQEIAQYGANNVVELIERLPGVVPLTGYVFQNNAVSIRGDLPNQNDTHFLILINGRPYKAGFSGTSNGILLQSFPVEMIERLEFIRGPGSVLYGSNAYSGVLNIITTPSRNQQSVTVTAGSWGTRRVSLSGGFAEDESGIQINLTSFDADGMPATFTDEVGVTDSTEYSEENRSLTLSGHYDNLRLDMFVSNTDDTHLGPIPRWPTGIIERDTRFLGLGYDHELNKRWELHTNLQYTSMNQDYNTSPNPLFDGYARELGLEVYTDGQLSEDINLLLGATVTRLTGEIAGGGALLPEYNERWSSLYTQVSYQATQDLDLFIGGQWHKAENIDPTFVPRLGGVYRWSSAWTTKLLYAEAFRSPYPAETGVVSPIVVGNPDLDAELVKTTDLQFIYQASSWQLASGIYYSKQEELIKRTPPGGPGVPGNFVNSGERKIWGVEMELQWRPLQQFSMQSSLTYQRNEDGNGMDDVTLAPDYLFKVGANYYPGAGVSLALFDNYTDDFKDVIILNPSRSAANPQAGGEHITSFNMGLHLPTLLPDRNLPDARIGLYITNLFDKELYVPEYTRANMNTLPAITERATYLQFVVNF